MSDKYWGIYCPQCGSWLPKTDGSLIFYPAREIAGAHLIDLNDTRINWHRYQVEEFGKEERINPERLNEDFHCPSLKFNPR